MNNLKWPADCIVWKHTTVTGHVGKRDSDFKPNPTLTDLQVSFISSKFPMSTKAQLSSSLSWGKHLACSCKRKWGKWIHASKNQILRETLSTFLTLLASKVQQHYNVSE